MKVQTALNFTVACFVLLNAHLVFSKVHVHGTGTLLIAQEQSAWQFEFVLPAADMLGFEHAPETTEQIQQINKLSQNIEAVQAVILLPEYCSVQSTSHNLNKLEKTEAHKHIHSHGHYHSQKAHLDISFTYIFKCDELLKSVDVLLFSIAPSLESIEAQWIVDGGQGASTINNRSNVIRF